MDVRQQDVERIVVEVLKKMMSDQPTAAATTVVAASGCDCGDFGLFDRLEDAVQAAEAAQKKISTVAMRDKIIAAIRKAGLENAKAFAEIAHNETGMGRVSDKIAKNILVCERTPGTECLSPMAISGDMGLTLIDFKIEVGYDEDGKMYVVDEITPDIWRVRDEQGNIPNQIDCAKLILDKI